MFGYWLNNRTVVSEKGVAYSAWEAHRACMQKPGSGAVCDTGTYNAGVYEDDFTANNSITLLRRRPQDRPFFLQVNFPGPHPPYAKTLIYVLSYFLMGEHGSKIAIGRVFSFLASIPAA